jgi:MSHA pilin protein MshC
MRHRGFTLIELISVIAIAGILAMMAMARFAGPSSFAVQGAADQIASALRQAQGMARAQRQVVVVVMQASPVRLRVCLDAACATPLEGPAGADNWLSDVEGLQLNASALVSFDAQGSPVAGSALAFRAVANNGQANSQWVRVDAVSGLVTVSPT